jgi:hypothetical protein
MIRDHRKNTCGSREVSSVCTSCHPNAPNTTTSNGRKVHANVTRNHRCQTIEELRRVIWYLHRETTWLRKSKPIRSGSITK